MSLGIVLDLGEDMASDSRHSRMLNPSGRGISKVLPCCKNLQTLTESVRGLGGLSVDLVRDLEVDLPTRARRRLISEMASSSLD